MAGGTHETWKAAFPPHKIVGNVYSVGTKTLSSFLIVSRQGNSLVDSTYERNVRTIQKLLRGRLRGELPISVPIGH